MTMTKAEWIRSRPPETPLAELVEEGRKLGLDMRPADVHAVRSLERKKQREKEARAMSESKANGKAKSGPKRPTPGADKCVAFIEDYIREHGKGPAGPELAAAMGYTFVGSISKIMSALKKAKRVTWEPGDYTTLRVLKKSGPKANGAALALHRPADDAPTDYHGPLRENLDKMEAELEAKLRAVREVKALLQ